MSDGLLLDTHILIWLDSGSAIRTEADIRIAEAAAAALLFLSDISVWEIGVAVHKSSFERRPNLQGLTVEEWFAKTTAKFRVRQLRISSRIALEAANVPRIYGSGDPGDCFLIATARIRRLSLATRDTKIIALAKRERGYLDVTVC
jgi:PIN domain nuclease of toxin-antitoxin system